MESLETLQKIREIEDLSSKKIEQAEEKAKKILEEAERLSEEKIKKAEKEANNSINTAIEKVEKETAIKKEEMIIEAKKKATDIKPLDENRMLEIFNDVLKEEFKL